MTPNEYVAQIINKYLFSATLYLGLALTAARAA